MIADDGSTSGGADHIVYSRRPAQLIPAARRNEAAPRQRCERAVKSVGCGPPFPLTAPLRCAAAFRDPGGKNRWPFESSPPPELKIARPPSADTCPIALTLSAMLASRLIFSTMRSHADIMPEDQYSAEASAKPKGGDASAALSGVISAGVRPFPDPP